MGITRRERDTMGEVDVPAERLWGAQTQRSLGAFRISTEKMPLELVHALARIKREVALAHADLGELAEAKARAIAAAADEVLAGAHDAEFPLSVWQTGSGTQTNMNVNEVLANRASELLGGPRGEGRLVHPNDDVNRGQSSNDVVPSALAVAAAAALETRVVPAARALARAIEERAAAFADVVKLGRTHLQDAVPLTVGQEMSAWVAQLARAADAVAATVPRLAELALGGTAVGTGLYARPEVAPRVARALAESTGLPVTLAPNRFAAIAAEDAAVASHAALRGLAVALTKIVNDVRWLASGPRAGLGELRLPANEPGSSMMPGKVNPTQCEAVAMAAAQVMGNDVTIGLAGASGALQLNAYRPVIAHAFLQSARLLADGCDSLREHGIAGLEVDRATIRAHVERSLMLVTALAPHVGYDAAARVAKRAHEDGTTLAEAAVALGVASAAEVDAWTRPEAMIPPS